MRRSAMPLALFVAILLSGCSSASQQVVGTWKGEVIPQDSPSAKSDSDPGKALESGIKNMINAFVGPLTLEFNTDGKYKASISLGSETGTYSVSGNEITLTPDKDGSDKKHAIKGTLVISSDGKTLRSKKEFSSDNVFELKKQ